MNDPNNPTMPIEEEVPVEEETDTDDGEKYDGGPIPNVSPPEN